jgi:hypothetical protein
LDESAALARKAKEAGPPCSECRYRTLLDMCGNPVYMVQEFSPATGEYSEKSRTKVAEARNDVGLCGPEALLFEPHGTVVPLLRGLWKGSKAGWVIFILGFTAFIALWH